MNKMQIVVFLLSFWKGDAWIASAAPYGLYNFNKLMKCRKYIYVFLKAQWLYMVYY